MSDDYIINPSGPIKGDEPHYLSTDYSLRFWVFVHTADDSLRIWVSVTSGAKLRPFGGLMDVYATFEKSVAAILCARHRLGNSIDSIDSIDSVVCPYDSVHVWDSVSREVVWHAQRK